MKPTKEKGNFNAAISCCFVLEVLFGALRARTNVVFPHFEIEKGSVPASCPTIIQLLLIITVFLSL